MEFMTVGVIGSFGTAPGNNELAFALRESIKQIANDAGVDLANVTVRAYLRNLRLGTFVAQVTKELDTHFEGIFDRFSPQREQAQMLEAHRILYVDDGNNERSLADALRLGSEARKIVYVVEVARHHAA